MVTKKQEDRDEGDNVTRKIWEDPGKILGRSWDWCDWEGETQWERKT